MRFLGKGLIPRCIKSQQGISGGKGIHPTPVCIKYSWGFHPSQPNKASGRSVWGAVERGRDGGTRSTRWASCPATAEISQRSNGLLLFSLFQFSTDFVFKTFLFPSTFSTKPFLQSFSVFLQKKFLQNIFHKVSEKYFNFLSCKKFVSKNIYI
jgi:hypothetical protein